jgi:DNA repair protein RecO (recombination protein O)
MLYKTKGVVLHTTDYSESSIVAKVFTEKFGQQSYLVNSVRNKKAKNKSSLFQPLTLVDMVVYHKPEKGLQRISEISSSRQLQTIPFDIPKTAVALFIAEVIYKSVKEEEVNENLFHFIETVILFLDEQQNGLANYPVFVLTQLTKHLGSFPENNFDSAHQYFDLLEGRFVLENINFSQSLNKPESALLNKLLLLRFENFTQEYFTNAERKSLLSSLVSYYHFHHTHGTKIKSHIVLEEVLG